MNYYNYPYNNYFTNTMQYQHLYQPIQPIYCQYQCFRSSRPYYKRQTQLVKVTQRQPYTIIGYSPSLQQDTADQELLKDMIIAVMEQSNNKMVKVFSDAVDLQKSQNPVEYILKTMALLKEVFNG